MFIPQTGTIGVLNSYYNGSMDKMIWGHDLTPADPQSLEGQHDLTPADPDPQPLDPRWPAGDLPSSLYARPRLEHLKALQRLWSGHSHDLIPAPIETKRACRLRWDSKTKWNHRGIADLWHLARTSTRYVLEYNLLFGVDVGVIFILLSLSFSAAVWPQDVGEVFTRRHGRPGSEMEPIRRGHHSKDPGRGSYQEGGCDIQGTGKSKSKDLKKNTKWDTCILHIWS